MGKLAALIGEKSPLVLRCILQGVNRELETSLGNGYEIESGLFGVCLGSRDAKEGMNAFFEKRKPLPFEVMEWRTYVSRSSQWSSRKIQSF
jgi:enoyl-CoA hydratase/carnithine racemase